MLNPSITSISRRSLKPLLGRRKIDRESNPLIDPAIRCDSLMYTIAAKSTHGLGKDIKEIGTEGSLLCAAIG